MEELLNFEVEPFAEAEPFEFGLETDEGELDGLELELGAASHPTLGPGRRVPRQGEVEEFEVPATAFHPLLGQGRRVLRTTGIESELEIIGADERTQVNDTKAVPFRWICSLQLTFPDPDDPKSVITLDSPASGTLISPRHVLTAGHCLRYWIKGSKGTPKVVTVARVRVTPGHNGSESPFGSALSAAVRYPDKWRDSLDPRFDYGLITLSKDIGSEKMPALGGKALSYWGSRTHGSGTLIKPKERSFFKKGLRINLSGYPADKLLATQWRSYDRVTNANPAAGQELIYYALDTCAGHSGSPVWLRWKHFRNLVAIHTGPCILGNDCKIVAGGKTCFPGAQQHSSNRGVLITNAVLNDLTRWMA